MEHNASVPADERFHGVRYDIEPYLAPGFQGPARQALLDGYVELLAGVAEIADGGGLAVGVDIPFWFDAPDEETNVRMTAPLAGRTAPLLEHVMSLVDDLAIMDYRTEAFGPNGALAHAYHELRMCGAGAADGGRPAPPPLVRWTACARRRRRPVLPNRRPGADAGSDLADHTAAGGQPGLRLPRLPRLPGTAGAALPRLTACPFFGSDPQAVDVTAVDGVLDPSYPTAFGHQPPLRPERRAVPQVQEREEVGLRAVAP